MPPAVYFASWVNTTIVAMFIFLRTMAYTSSWKLHELQWVASVIAYDNNFVAVMVSLRIFPSISAQKVNELYVFWYTVSMKKIGEENRRIVMWPLASPL